MILTLAASDIRMQLQTIADLFLIFLPAQTMHIVFCNRGRLSRKANARVYVPKVRQDDQKKK